MVVSHLLGKTDLKNSVDEYILFCSFKKNISCLHHVTQTDIITPLDHRQSIMGC